jgi:hypothetical protein
MLAQIFKFYKTLEKTSHLHKDIIIMLFFILLNSNIFPGALNYLLKTGGWEN